MGEPIAVPFGNPGSPATHFMPGKPGGAISPFRHRIVKFDCHVIGSLSKIRYALTTVPGVVLPVELVDPDPAIQYSGSLTDRS